MAKNWSIHCAAHIKTSTKGSMVEIVVSAGDSRISRYFALADINTNPVEVYRWLGQCGIVATTDVKKKVVHAVSDLPDPAAGWAAEAPGWYEKAFALPTGVIGVGSHNVLNLIEATSAEKWRCRGTLQAWRRKIAAPLGKSPVAVFALSAALTGPILQLAGATNLVVMIVGPSSVGKSTLLEVCASAWGGGGDQSFASTFLKSPEEFEVAALHHRDALLTLDETMLLGNNKVDAAQKFQKIVFRFDSEKPKQIFRQESSNQALRGVRLFTSNRSTAEMLQEANIAFEGQEAVRVLEIKVNPHDFPVFRFDDQKTAKNATRVERMKRRSRKYCGRASRKFIKRLVEDRVQDEAALIKRVRRHIQEALDLFRLPPHASAMEFRIARQVAIAFAAGRLACQYGVLPFKRGRLRKAFLAVWSNVHRQAIESVGHNPVREFVQNLGALLEQLTDLDAGLPTLTRGEAEAGPGFKKTKRDGRLAIYLSANGLAHLTSAEELVLRWLEGHGYLRRDRRPTAVGSSPGKRQVKVVVARKRDGSNVRLRLYEIVGDISEMRRAAGVP